jgi:nucleoside-diphosphate-sugar epimerase
MPNVLITGANGFIGSNLCRYFLDKGFITYGLVRETSDLHFLDELNVDLIYGDLTEVRKIELPPDLDFVIHCASTVSDVADMACCEANICSSSISLVQHIIGNSIPIKRFIYMSTALVLGYRRLNISEENPGKSADKIPYVACKKKTEGLLLDLQKELQFPVVILRPADVFGPNDRVTCMHILKGIEDGVPVIVGHGRWIFPYCYIDNLCLATYLACTTENIDGSAYTVTNGSEVTWRELFSFFLKKLKKRQRIYIPVFVPYLVAFGMKVIHLFVPSYEPPLTGYRIRRVTSHTNYDISKTLRELNYVPDNRTEQQFEAIVDWYLSERKSGHIK